MKHNTLVGTLHGLTYLVVIGAIASAVFLVIIYLDPDFFSHGEQYGGEGVVGLAALVIGVGAGLAETLWRLTLGRFLKLKLPKSTIGETTRRMEEQAVIKECLRCGMPFKAYNNDAHNLGFCNLKCKELYEKHQGGSE